MRIRGFTLIELLIVVAIIAILAAIAVPNFLEAQTRAKVSRTLADQRSLATALESYVIDHNVYPPAFEGAWLGFSVFDPGNAGAVSARFIPLTTPIAYITSVFPEPFAVNGVAAMGGGGGGSTDDYDTYDYIRSRDFEPSGILGMAFNGCGAAITSGSVWRLSGVGPDRIQGYGGRFESDGPLSNFNVDGHDYDATNGTISSGDIIRIGGVGPLSGTQVPFINRVSGQIND